MIDSFVEQDASKITVHELLHAMLQFIQYCIVVKLITKKVILFV